MKFWFSASIAAVIILAAVYAGSQGNSGHSRFSITCANCHIVEPKKGDNPKDMIFLKDVSLLCMDCHNMVKKASHPVGLKPSMNIPKYFPLDWQGRNTCITCHAVHDGGYGRYILRSEKTVKAFCIECHGKSLEEGVGMHKSMAGSAHFGSRYTVEDKGAVIDELSMQCLSCHDGQLGSDVRVDILGSGTFEHSREVGVSHPIGSDYKKVYSMDTTRLVNPALLPREIKLFADKIGCGSCHNPYSDMHSQLVMSNSRSALCAACHIK